jgi:hypothetical protein
MTKGKQILRWTPEIILIAETVFYWISSSPAIIGTDIFVYLVLGILQMDYDDNYDSSKGEYWSLSSMNKLQLVYFFLLQLWNILNLCGLLFIGRRIYKRIKYGT